MKYVKEKKITITLDNSCRCKRESMRPNISCCGDKNHIKQLISQHNNKLYIKWKQNNWFEKAFNISMNYYLEKDIEKDYMEEYLLWLLDNEKKQTFFGTLPYHLTPISIKEIKFQYVADVLAKEFNPWKKEFIKYEKSIHFITNPYIGYYINNLDVLACLELPWTTVVLPK